MSTSKTTAGRPAEPLSRLMSVALCISLTCVLAGCHDTRSESFYPSLPEAERDGAITRHWIPDFLPRSSRNIHDIGDLSPSRVWCAFEFLPADSEQFRKSLKAVGSLPPAVRHVPTPGKSWWPAVLEGNIDLERVHEAGFQLYLVEEPATPSTTAVYLFAIDWAKGRGFFYLSSA